MEKCLLVDQNDRIIYENVIRQYPWIIERERNCILSPDSDGLLCGLFMQSVLDWNIVGFYDGKVMLLKDDIELGDCVFLDMEIFRDFIKSIGQHMLMWSAKKDKQRPEWLGFRNCISVNNIRDFDGKTKFNKKFPLATIHILLAIVGSVKNVPIETSAICPLLYTDGTFKNMFNYPENVLDWLRFLCADDERNPLYTVFFNNMYSTHDLMSALKDFFGKVREIGRKKRGGDKIQISDKSGSLVNVQSMGNGKYELCDEQRRVANGFVNFLSGLTGWRYDEAKWFFSGFRAYKFLKSMIVPNGRNFDELIIQNPISWAMTSTNHIEYTVESDRFV